MAIEHIDAYKYVGLTSKRYTNAQGSLVLTPGILFYYVTMSKPGNYISLDKAGPYFKISDKSFEDLSSKADEFQMSVDLDVLKTSDGSVRSFQDPVNYREAINKRKGTIREVLSKFLSPSKFKITKIDEGYRYGYQVTSKNLKYQLCFYLGHNPFFSYSIWVPRSSKVTLDDLPKWAIGLSKKIPEIQGILFSKLKFKVNLVQPRRSVVHLPQKNFYGTIYQWVAKI